MGLVGIDQPEQAATRDGDKIIPFKPVLRRQPLIRKTLRILDCPPQEVRLRLQASIAPVRQSPIKVMSTLIDRKIGVMTEQRFDEIVAKRRPSLDIGARNLGSSADRPIIAKGGYR